MAWPPRLSVTHSSFIYSAAGASSRARCNPGAAAAAAAAPSCHHPLLLILINDRSQTGLFTDAYLTFEAHVHTAAAHALACTAWDGPTLHPIMTLRELISIS